MEWNDSGDSCQNRWPVENSKIRKKKISLHKFVFFRKIYQFDSGSAKCRSYKLWHFDSNSYFKSLIRNDKTVSFQSFPVESIFTKKNVEWNLNLKLQFGMQSIKYWEIATYKRTYVGLCKILCSNIFPEQLLHQYLLMFWIVAPMKWCVNIGVYRIWVKAKNYSQAHTSFSRLKINSTANQHLTHYAHSYTIFSKTV